MLDTGILYSVARDSLAINRVLRHFCDRLLTTDVIAQEVGHRASSRVDHTRQLEKNAAATAKQLLIDSGAVQVTCPLTTEENVVLFDQVVAQLRELAVATGSRSEDEEEADKHAGEASAIVYIKGASGSRPTVLYTNDGGASVIAAVHQIDSRHYGQMLQELVCAGECTSTRAFQAFETAQRVTKIAADLKPGSEADLACHQTDGDCPICP